MTPAIISLKKKHIPYTIHQYDHEAGGKSYGMEAAEKLGVDPSRVYKTLVVMLDSGNLAVAILPVAEKLNMKLVAKAAGVRKAAMAKKSDAERSTGYLLGGISPIGQKKRLPTFLDRTAEKYSTIFISGGRRGVDIEIAPSDMLKVVGGTFHFLCQ